jgi:uncharacterized protein (TIGR04255 family)
MKTISKRKKLARAPLTVALCQVRFSTIRNMTTYIPQVQVALRKDGYRLDMSSQVQEFVFGPQGQQQPRAFDRWEFMNVEKTRSVVVTEQFAAFQTTAYTTFDEFVPEVIRMMDALAAAGADVLITRVGLRYVDAIIPSAGKTWRDYLSPSLHGIQLPSLNGALTAYHVFGETAQGRILARMTQNTEGLLVPLEMAQQNLVLQRQPPASGTIITLIDIDHFKEWTKDFSGYQADALGKLAWDLKSDIYEVFHCFVTGAAIEEWT